MIFGGTSITWASVATGSSDPSYRTLIQQWLAAAYPDESWSAVSAAQGGTNSWSNLFRLDLTSPPDLFIFDVVNDRDSTLSRASMEALIRRVLRANPNVRIVAMNFMRLARQEDELVDTPSNAVTMQDLRDLATYYGFPIVDWYAVVDRQVDGGHHVSEYLFDTVHPSGPGHALAYRMLAPVVAGERAIGAPPGAVSTPFYTATIDYEQEPTRLPAAAYDDRGGTWVNTSAGMETSQAGATVTYSGVFRSIGANWISGAVNGPVEYSLDGGPWTPFTLTRNGWEVADKRGQHTITIRVVSGTVWIAEIWML